MTDEQALASAISECDGDVKGILAKQLLFPTSWIAVLDAAHAHLASLQRKGETGGSPARDSRLDPQEQRDERRAWERSIAAAPVEARVSVTEEMIRVARIEIIKGNDCDEGCGELYEGCDCRNTAKAALESALSRGPGRMVTEEMISAAIKGYNDRLGYAKLYDRECVGAALAAAFAVLQPASITDEMIGRATSIMMASVNGVATDDAYEIARMMLEAAFPQPDGRTG